MEKIMKNNPFLNKKAPFLMLFNPMYLKYNWVKTKTFMALLIFSILLTSFTIFQIPPQLDTVSGTENPASCTNVNNSTFQPGEELVYKIYYNLNFVWIPAGEVTFKIMDEGSSYHLSAKGRTYSSYEWFYKVRDNYDTWVDKNTMLPTLSIREVNENRYQLYDKVTYDQNGKKATYERGKTKNDIRSRGTVNMNDCMHDVLSIVYYSRTFDYANAQTGKEYPVKVMLDEEVYPLKYKLTGREEKKVKDIGKWSTLKFTPQLVAGNVFNENAQMKVWASDDANKVPLMIESPVAVGSVKVVLKSANGLKYSMSAKKE
jgi:Protein of unknown function (DUF3108)